MIRFESNQTHPRSTRDQTTPWIVASRDPGVYLATCYSFGIKRLRNILFVEQILRHEQIIFGLDSPSFKIPDLYGVKPKQFREDSRLPRRVHVLEV